MRPCILPTAFNRQAICQALRPRCCGANKRRPEQNQLKAALGIPAPLYCKRFKSLLKVEAPAVEAAPLHLYYCWF